MRDLLRVETLLSRNMSYCNLELFYIISFKPPTICDLVTGLSFSLDVLVLVEVVLGSGVILLQLRENMFTLIKRKS